MPIRPEVKELHVAGLKVQIFKLLISRQMIMAYYKQQLPQQYTMLVKNVLIVIHPEHHVQCTPMR